jgi:hypothetical protein
MRQLDYVVLRDQRWALMCLKSSVYPVAEVVPDAVS